MSEPWALRLYNQSPLKRDKVSAIFSLLGDVRDQRCLDLGSDNGVVSLLLRRRGGSWASGDLTEETVESIRALVATDVHLVTEQSLPFLDDTFDTVVVADMIEHVHDEATFVSELSRVLKPRGRLIVNTPHANDTWLRRLRLALGQTDERHGHARHGYTRESIGALLKGDFELESSATYGRVFSEIIDTAMQWALERLGKKGSPKGMVITGGDLNRHARLFKAYSLVFPFVWAFSRLDRLVPWTEGYRLLVGARRKAS